MTRGGRRAGAGRPKTVVVATKATLSNYRVLWQGQELGTVHLSTDMEAFDGDAGTYLTQAVRRALGLTYAAQIRLEKTTHPIQLRPRI
jgi:hypothetical protein